MRSEQPNNQPTWEAIRREATDLEITFDDSLGDVWMNKPGNGDFGWFQDSLAGRLAAWDWLVRARRTIEERDYYRSLDPQPRRRMHLRWLFGR